MLGVIYILIALVVQFCVHERELYDIQIVQNEKSPLFKKHSVTCLYMQTGERDTKICAYIINTHLLTSSMYVYTAINSMCSWQIILLVKLFLNNAFDWTMAINILW